MSILRKRSFERNKITYYGNRIAEKNSPIQGYVEELNDDEVFPGCIMAYVMPTAPRGWFICNGAAINREVYKKLFDTIGTTFGQGDGVNTFNLPNYQGAFLRGTGTNAGYTGPSLNVSQTHATQTHNHTATTAITDPSHSHGTTQSDHSHNFVDAYYIENNGNVAENNLPGSGSTDTDNNYYYTRSAITDPAQINITINNATTGITAATTVNNSTLMVDPNETRPYNFGINWIIRY